MGQKLLKANHEPSNEQIIIMTLFHVLVTSIALRAQAIPSATNYYIFQRLLVNFKSLVRLDKAQQDSKGLDKV